MSHKLVIGTTIAIATIAIVVAVSMNMSKPQSTASTTANAGIVKATYSANYSPTVILEQTKNAEEWAAFRNDCRARADEFNPVTGLPNLSGCSFYAADGGPAEGDYSQRNFSGANFANVNLVGALYSDTNFSGANLSGASLSFEWDSTNFTGADFTGANLRGAVLAKADLSHADFTNADLTRARLHSKTFLGENAYWALLDDVIWSNTTCPDGTNSDANNGTCANNLVSTTAETSA